MAYTIYVTYTAKGKGNREAFVRELHESGVAPAVRAEDGCLLYDYYFSAQDDLSLLLIEKWESKEHQQIHLTQPHIATLKEIKAKYIADSHLGEFQLV